MTANARREPWGLAANAGARLAARVPTWLRALAVRWRWPRRILLRLIFMVMERRVDPERAQDLDVVVHWEIGEREGGSVERWQVAIRAGVARASRVLDAQPRLKIKLDAPTFLELATGLAAAPALFMAGRVSIEGDMMLAARMQSIFRIPRPGRRASAG